MNVSNQQLYVWSLPNHRQRHGVNWSINNQADDAFKSNPREANIPYVVVNQYTSLDYYVLVKWSTSVLNSVQKISTQSVLFALLSTQVSRNGISRWYRPSSGCKRFKRLENKKILILTSESLVLLYSLIDCTEVIPVLNPPLGQNKTLFARTWHFHTCKTVIYLILNFEILIRYDLNFDS